MSSVPGPVRAAPRRGLQVLAGVLLGLAAAGVILFLYPPERPAEGGGATAPASPGMQSPVRFREPPDPLPDVTLVTHSGEPMRLQDLPFPTSIVFFGYTHCPDVCPLTLDRLARALRILEDRGEASGTGVVFVSVDPARDTPERLAEYLSRFSSRFLGLTGSEEDLRAAAYAFRVRFEEVMGHSGTGHTVTHSARTFVVEPGRGILAAIPPLVEPEVVVRAIEDLAGR